MKQNWFMIFGLLAVLLIAGVVVFFIPETGFFVRTL